MGLSQDLEPEKSTDSNGGLPNSIAFFMFPPFWDTPKTMSGESPTSPVLRFYGGIFFEQCVDLFGIGYLQIWWSIIAIIIFPTKNQLPYTVANKLIKTQIPNICKKKCA